MSHKRRWIAAVLVLALLAGMFFVGKSGMQILPKGTENHTEQSGTEKRTKNTVYIWYADAAMADVLNSAAVSYNESHENVRIVPVETSGLEFLEAVNQASMDENTVPDLYILPNDSLEKAYLGGLAAALDEEPQWCDTNRYPQAALNAASYKGKLIGYPFYFETSALIYNKTYLEDYVKYSIEAAADAAAGEAAQAEIDANGAPKEVAQEIDTTGMDLSGDNAQVEEEELISPEELEARVLEEVPTTFLGMQEMADSYDAPEQVEAILSWDVTDIFYTYFFAGAYINAGGPCGDDTASIDIYNEDAIHSMMAFQELNQFFSIDTEESNYDTVLQNFIDGKLVFTIATPDAIAKIEQAKAEGAFPYDYGTAMIPDINDELDSRSMSVTDCLVVNAYSEHKNEAQDFAKYLVEEVSGDLFGRAGKVPASKQAELGNPNLQAFVEEYGYSVPIPKMVETSNFWLYLEATFANIWNGKDANAELKALSEQMMTQITGEPFEEEYIEVKIETDQVEYLDEEELRREAMGDEENSEDN